MSMTTLGKMQDYYREMDDAEDRYYASQSKKRGVKLDPDEVARRANILYGKVTKVIGKYASNGTSNVPLATHPECVVQRVIDMLAQKGIKAEHVYNELHPTYDALKIDMASVKIG
jgi:hypothetical protein